MRTSGANRVSPENEVTPDLCICDLEKNGIIGEVKRSFPRNHDYWIEDFKQLMKYDDKLSNWMTESKQVNNLQIVLLPEQTRARDLVKFYEEHKGKDISFENNFVIVQFNRNDQAKSYFFFRKEYGTLNVFTEEDKKLESGISVPLEKLMLHYEKIKLYDSQPPLPYLLFLIWENIVMRKAYENENIKNKRKISVILNVDDIIKELRINYTFNQINSHNDSNQQEIPKKSWIVEAINALASFDLAKWQDDKKDNCIIYFSRYRDTLKTFIDLCEGKTLGIGKLDNQPSLFDS
jgi:hypothetical protein